MIGKIFGIMCIISFVFGVYTGNLEQMGAAVIESSTNAVELTLSLIGIMCLWNGIMNVASECGFVDRMARLMSPVLCFLFPDAYKKKNGIGEIATSITANVLGIGNAATPLALKAMGKLQENNIDKTSATGDMIMFTVLGTASFDFFPTTLIALRKAANSSDPFGVVVPVWICSFITATVAVLLVKIYVSAVWREKKIGEKRGI